MRMMEFQDCGYSKSDIEAFWTLLDIELDGPLCDDGSALVHAEDSCG